MYNINMKTMFFAVLFTISCVAQAAPYMTIGAGAPYTGEPVSVKAVGVAGFGVNVTKSVAVELDYRWLGSSSGYSDYEQDPTYANIGTDENPIYACATDPCNHQKQYVDTSSKGAALSLVFENLMENGRVGHSLRVGVYNRTTKYAEHWEAPITVDHSSVKADSNGLTAVLGVGFRFDNLRVEMIYFDKAFYDNGRLDPLVAAYVNYLIRF